MRKIRYQDLYQGSCKTYRLPTSMYTFYATRMNQRWEEKKGHFENTYATKKKLTQ